MSTEYCTLRAEPIYETGFTLINCNECGGEWWLGSKPKHYPSCIESATITRRHKITEITKISTFKVACEVMDDGTVIIP